MKVFHRPGEVTPRTEDKQSFERTIIDIVRRNRGLCPLPIDRSRAPFFTNRRTAFLACTACFAAGASTALIFANLILRHK